MAQWIELMEPIAYGARGLTPWEFGSLTVTEFLKMVKGYQWRQEQERLARVYLAVPIINACARNLKKPITLETLLGYDPLKKTQEKEEREKSGQELRDELLMLKKKWGE